MISVSEVHLSTLCGSQVHRPQKEISTVCCQQTSEFLMLLYA